MLESVLEIGERPADLIVDASLAKAVRDWESYRRITAALTTLRDDQTLVLQSGKPIGVFTTTVNAPMVVSAIGNVVGRYATPERFYDAAALGLIIWGGLTAGAWQYIGSQGVLQGTYEMLCEVAREHFDGTLRGRLVLTSGLGGTGSAQPTAIRMTGAVGLVVEVDPAKLQQRLGEGSIDEVAPSLDDALDACQRAQRGGTPRSVGFCGNVAEVIAELVDRGVTPDVVTDQTAAHDALFGYVPIGLDVTSWRSLREEDPDEVTRRARESMAQHVTAMLVMRERGAVVFENGNNLRVQAQEAGVANALDIDGFAERYIRPMFCRGIGPFCWIALSGDDADLAVLDDLVGTVIERRDPARWIELARRNVVRQGLPARTCWLGHGERSKFAIAANSLVASGRLSAPVLFTRDHFDAAAMTHPHSGTEGMRDGSDAISDWPMLDAMLLCATGADLVAIHAGGGGYSGYMQSAGVSIVADGSDGAAARLGLGFDADTGLGVLRYADAGYEIAEQQAANSGLGLGTAGG